MATLEENINNMAALVQSMVKTYRLTQPSALRIIDMNIAIMQQNQGNRPPMPEDDTAIADALYPADEEAPATEEEVPA